MTICVTTSTTVRAVPSFATTTHHVEELTEDELFQRHVTVIDSYVHYVEKFLIDGHQTRFVLRDLDRADDPVRVLERVMGRLTGIARVAFNVEGMQSDFLVPFRPPEENNAEKFSAAIDEQDQSEKEDSVRFYQKEMNLMITVVKRIEGSGRNPFVDDKAECSDSEGEDDYDDDEEEDEDAPDASDSTDDAPRPSRRARRAQERAMVAARRKRQRKRKRKIEYVPGESVIENALIRVPKDDTRFLFYAIAVARHYAIAMDDEEKKDAGRSRLQISSDANIRQNASSTTANV